ncbi:MAG: toprim domain-containing protein, partial [Lawsonibacter sp.]|nr:toprim domain-containing protein [Lawsonibacter sp.]
SNPVYSFHYISKNPNPHSLFVFEAPIDLLSYISLHPQNWKNASYVALNGVSEQPVLKLLELYPQLQRVTLCLDNDEAGRKAASRIHKTLKEHGFEAVVYEVSAHKDWNEDLKAAYSQEQTTPAMVMR